MNYKSNQLVFNKELDCTYKSWPHKYLILEKYLISLNLIFLSSHNAQKLFLHKAIWRTTDLYTSLGKVLSCIYKVSQSVTDFFKVIWNFKDRIFDLHINFRLLRVKLCGAPERKWNWFLYIGQLFCYNCIDYVYTHTYTQHIHWFQMISKVHKAKSQKYYLSLKWDSIQIQQIVLLLANQI